jgi:O-glycosyl hydrolase
MKYLSKMILGVSSVLFVLTGTIKSQTVTIDLNTEYQPIAGFGGVNMPGWIPDLSLDLVDKAFGNEPGQMGLSILRVRVPNDTTQFFREVPTAVRAKNHGAIIMASPWSPPAALKSNNNTTGGYLLPENYGAFADHLLDFVSYMYDTGAPLHAVSIQNEPDIEVNYESCDWTAKQFINFLEQEGNRFDTIQVIAPESFQFRRPLSDSILNDPEAEPHVDIIGGHIYGGGLFDYPLARDKGKEVWMTEHLTGSSDPSANTWSLALDLATEINNCMKANFNAYIWWYLRRFYGPLDDAGNVTKKGYVMSQFSKFIRPGAVRVDGIVGSAPNVDATAYKTDSSLVIIVVNRNSAATDIEFTIQNGVIDSLTKFTTSETKNVVNDGGVQVSGGIFQATVDGRSITTFTSYDGNGGKFGNSAPVADGGADLVLSDTDGNGTETVMLDGTASTDSDGVITNYSWSLNDMQVAWEPTYELTVPIGDHVLVLTVTDDDGATHADTLIIAVTSLFSTEIWLEAECGVVGSTWEILDDNLASNELYAATPLGTESTAGISTDTADLIVFNFHVPEAGPYKLWGRVITPNANDDSFWIRMDDGTTALWNSIPAGSDWHWAEVFDQGNESQVMTYSLDTGYHSLTVCFREDGALLDKFLLVNTGAIPDGTGGIDASCPEDPVSGNAPLAETGTSGVLVFPNPAQSAIGISWQHAFTTLEIFNIQGSLVFRENYGLPVNSVQVITDLEPGIYFIVVGHEQEAGIEKLLINR